MVEHTNPYDTSRKICIFHCSTHDLKNIRGALFTSWWQGGKKQFLDENDVPIGKGIVEECLSRDAERQIRGMAPITRLRDSTVHLTNWSKMNASESKRVFEEKTCAEIATNLYESLGIDQSNHLNRETHGAIGYWPAVATHLQFLLVLQPEKAVELGPKVSSFEFIANVHEIFIATLMNMECLVNLENIDRLEAQIKKCLSYFERKRKRQLERKTMEDDDWYISFLAPQTWANLRLTCRGFFSVLPLCDSLCGQIWCFYPSCICHFSSSCKYKCPRGMIFSCTSNAGRLCHIISSRCWE